MLGHLTVELSEYYCSDSESKFLFQSGDLLFIGSPISDEVSFLIHFSRGFNAQFVVLDFFSSHFRLMEYLSLVDHRIQSIVNVLT